MAWLLIASTVGPAIPVGGLAYAGLRYKGVPRDERVIGTIVASAFMAGLGLINALAFVYYPTT